MPITLDRNLNAATNTELKSSQLTLVPLLYLDFPSLIKYYAGANTNIVVRNSNIMPAGTYVGVGGISSIGTVEETVDLKSTNLVAKLNGIDSTYIALVLAENYYGRDAYLSLAALDQNYQVVGDPLLLFRGFMSVLSIDLESQTSISVELESIFADWERPRANRWNNTTQEDIDPADKGFDNVADLVHKEVTWG